MPQSLEDLAYILFCSKKGVDYLLLHNCIYCFCLSCLYSCKYRVFLDGMNVQSRAYNI